VFGCIIVKTANVFPLKVSLYTALDTVSIIILGGLIGVSLSEPQTWWHSVHLWSDSCNFYVLRRFT